MKRITALAAAAVLSAGCYHATVETGLTAGSTVIDVPWAMSYVGGLIPPATVNAAARCPVGVARVETEHSFLNMLVQGVTFGIVTPMHIRITCASQGRMGAAVPAADIVVPVATQLAIQAAFAQAADMAVASRAPVFVQVPSAAPQR